MGRRRAVPGGAARRRNHSKTVGSRASPHPSRDRHHPPRPRQGPTLPTSDFSSEAGGDLPYLVGVLRLTLLPGWPLQLHGVAFRIGHIDGRPLALGAVAGVQRPGLDACCLEMGTDGRLVEGFDAETEMIHVVRLAVGWPSAGAPQGAVHGHQIQQGAPGTELDQAHLVLPPLHRAAQHLAVEMHHRLQVHDPQHHVVQFSNLDHGWLLSLPLKPMEPGSAQSSKATDLIWATTSMPSTRPSCSLESRVMRASNGVPAASSRIRQWAGLAVSPKPQTLAGRRLRMLERWWSATVVSSTTAASSSCAMGRSSRAISAPVGPEATARPWSSSTMWSASRATSSREWLT